jgi:hypothetical protein
MKPLAVVKMYLTETYTRVLVGKNLSDMWPIRNGLNEGDGLSPLVFTFDLQYAISLACNYFVNIFFWVMLMMLIYWEAA